MRMKENKEISKYKIIIFIYIKIESLYKLYKNIIIIKSNY
jgi:hypothetical protein